MATDTRTLIPTSATAADFRLWGQGVAAALVACGLVKTADTGQINWATVAAPGVANTFMGYEIYRFSDTLQATAPVFIRIEFGSGASAAAPNLKLSVGTTTSGAGVLGGQVSEPRTGHANFADSASSGRVCYASGDGSYINYVLFPGGTTGTYNRSMCFFIVDRTRNNDGTANGDGIFFAAGDGMSIAAPTVLEPGVKSQVIPFAGIVPTAKTHWATILPGRSMAAGADLSLAPVVPFTPKQSSPLLGVLAYWDPDVARSSNIVVPMYGVNHTYKALGSWVGGVCRDESGTLQANHCAAIRFE